MMKRLSTTRVRKKGEPTIALINIVFLMLIFFLIAGTVAAPLDNEMKLVNLSDLQGVEPPDALLVFPDRRLVFRGEETNIESHIAFHRDALIDTLDKKSEDVKLTVRLVPDRQLPAKDLIALANELKKNGVARVVVVMERQL